MKRMMMMVALAAFLVAALSVSALSAFAASPLAEECAANEGTWDSSSKTCVEPVGNQPQSQSDVTKVKTYHDAGNGDQTGRTHTNPPR